MNLYPSESSPSACVAHEMEGRTASEEVFDHVQHDDKLQVSINAGRERGKETLLG